MRKLPVQRFKEDPAGTARVALRRARSQAPELIWKSQWALTHRLDPLAKLVGTDKASSWHGYTRYYERHFRERRRQIKSVLEIGVGGTSSGDGYETTTGGASLRMWADYFPSAHVLGVDIFDKQIPGERISFERGDQSDPAFLEFIAKRYGPFDVVIDDGSHIGRHVIASINGLWDAVKPGGWYVVEDLAVAYDPEYEGGEPGTPDTAAALIKEWVDHTILRYRKPDRPPVAELHLYGGIVFFKKSDDHLWVPPW